MVTSKRRGKKDGSPRKRSSNNTAAKSEVDYACEPIDYEATLTEWVKDRIVNPQYRVTELHVLSFKMIAVAKEAARVFEIGGRARIEEIVEKGLHEEAESLLRSGRDPLQRLKRLLAFLSMQDVPLYDDLMDETSEVVQAVQYSMKRILDLRGGPKQVMKEAPYLIPSMVLYLLPSWDQVDISNTAEEMTEDITDMYSLIFPYTLCPRELFTEILRTNQLRAKASAAIQLCGFNPEHALEAYDVLGRIEAFSVEDWARAGTFCTEWLTVGLVYKSAVALYATLSLCSLMVLPTTASLLESQTAYGDVLLSNLGTALKAPRMAKFMVWPLIVAGVEAMHRGEGTRNWIEAGLEDLSRTLGTSCPLKVCSVLKRYWKGGVAGWDECFDQSYVFAI
ncbi:hypothetical protein J4E83_005044 [Alternaria metachromatica]|uniref:uncharacterized protein n=1 Tax=Alternaria metachromatica TaxID=283354 RepID=UPI0020C47CF6|nr:uncharacterized protein J4E83_005044 [Alternaria metachromatica]KAI4622302.1 hypothetical protein J4E83_005044 [Alternaria metachromatica]